MNRYRAEILGRVPYGLTHNDVYATILSMANERVNAESVTKRRLARGHVSIIVVFEATDLVSADREIRYIGSSVTNFSFDVIGPYLQRS